MISLGHIKVGNRILFRNAPHEVLQANHLKMGRSGAKLTTKLRNLIDNSVIEYTFAGEERLEEADVSYRAAQYLYQEGSIGHFMVNDTFEQVSATVTEAQTKFLTEGSSVDLVLWQEQVIGVKPPKKVVLEISFAEPAVKGNTVNAATKNATLETGAQIQVPMFINSGDTVEVNTETGEYVGRVSK